MITIAHLSDLHFGTEDGAMVDRLVAELAELRPRLTVISGDLTQRARRRQFAAARAFLERLPGPRVVVPGNHDIPLYDLPRRIVAPMRRYRSMIADQLDQLHMDDDLTVLALNTSRPWRWTEGSISSRQVGLVAASFARAPARARRVLVTHHPFMAPREQPRTTVVHGQQDALPAIERAGVELLLAGHLHLGYTEAVVRAPHVLSVQAGTATSHRLRGQPNGYNVIRLGDGLIDVEQRAWTGSSYAVRSRLETEGRRGQAGA